MINDRANTRTKLPIAGQKKINWPMGGQYYVLFVGTMQSFPEVSSKGDCEGPVVHINDLGDVEIYVNLRETRKTTYT